MLGFQQDLLHGPQPLQGPRRPSSLCIACCWAVSEPRAKSLLEKPEHAVLETSKLALTCSVQLKRSEPLLAKTHARTGSWLSCSHLRASKTLASRRLPARTLTGCTSWSPARRVTSSGTSDPRNPRPEDSRIRLIPQTCQHQEMSRMDLQCGKSRGWNRHPKHKLQSSTATPSPSVSSGKAQKILRCAL